MLTVSRKEWESVLAVHPGGTLERQQHVGGWRVQGVKGQHLFAQPPEQSGAVSFDNELRHIVKPDDLEEGQISCLDCNWHPW